MGVAGGGGGGQWQGVAVQGIKLPPAPLSSLPFFLPCFVFFFFKIIFLLLLVTVFRAGGLKNSLSSHRYNLVLKKPLFPSTKTPPKYQWCSWAAVFGGPIRWPRSSAGGTA